MYKPRKKFVVLVGMFSATAAFLMLHREDIREIPDRWHAPFFNPEPPSTLNSPTDIFTASPMHNHVYHPIDDLIERSELALETLLKKQNHNVSASAAAYRERRGRHPPPEFDKWFEYADAHSCLVIEDFFDQIYRDIEPFWALTATHIRESAMSLPNIIHVRNGKVSKSSDKGAFLDAYFDLFKELGEFLPDVDIPINEMDESRILLSWEDVDRLVTTSTSKKDLARKPSETSFRSIDGHIAPAPPQTWLHEGPYWNIARNGCHPESPGRLAAIDLDFSAAPEFLTSWPSQTYNGFVSNWTIAKNPCIHAHLRNIHGSFVEPISQSTTTKLLPMFSGSKMPFNNDILLPGAVYWDHDHRFSAGNSRVPWERKRNEVLWRGSASGGRSTERNWTRFHRHRLLSMLNGTQVQMTIEAHNAQAGGNSSQEGLQATHTTAASAGHEVPQNFPFPNQTLYPLRSFSQGLLPDWIRSLSNAAFTWLVCFPATKNYACGYTGSWYRRGGEMPLYRMFNAKYLPDVDGNSFSGRYRAFLGSDSLPIKATIYNEWHDDRLIPWRHFVPMDNTYMDLWAILEYFVGHDDKAREIALQGQSWSEKVLRREDILVYVYRLILEYARVSSNLREEMGWAADL
jgi:hypothetical protein